MTRILLVEDNADLAAGLAGNLRLEGFEVQVCADGAQVHGRVLQARPDLLILDMMLPNRDGFSVLKQLRDDRIDTPVLCLTARGEEMDKVRALRGGADDYVTKPFGLMELIARVEALLRRRAVAVPVSSFGPVKIDRAARAVSVAGQPAALTPQEYDLLMALAAHPGEVCSRQQLMREAWGHSGVVVSRTVDTHIAELRRKLEPDPSQPRWIVTVRKAGYRLDHS